MCASRQSHRNTFGMSTEENNTINDSNKVVPENNTNTNTNQSTKNNNTVLTDTTEATTNIPHTGVNNVGIISLIGVALVAGIVTFIKYKNI